MKLSFFFTLTIVGALVTLAAVRHATIWLAVLGAGIVAYALLEIYSAISGRSLPWSDPGEFQLIDKSKSDRSDRYRSTLRTLWLGLLGYPGDTALPPRGPLRSVAIIFYLLLAISLALAIVVVALDH